ncbi:MAG: hypothetical protein HY694_15065 [Deltaproteobacteria bacterium]|nr:hypothetical protein [Deltaproteobacteria bacterium]
MKNPFAVAQKYLDAPQSETPSPEVVEDKTILGVKICSHILEDEIWLILDRAFIPTDGLACYYAEEIPLLRDKTPEELREIHKVKLAFPACRVIQEGAEKIADKTRV